jgi:cytoskeleton protein RodZ
MTKLTHMSLENDGDAEKDGVKPRRIHLREISGDGDAPLETVGQDLRAARLRRGDEIAQVSRALKIRKDHLEALENDRLEDLPGKTYAIGFVRSYSRHLGLDSATYVERFKQDISGRPEEQKNEPAAIHQEEGRRLPQGWRIIAGVVVLLLGYGAWHLLSAGGESMQPVPPAPVLNPPRPKPAPPPQPVVIPAQTATPSPAADNSATPGAPAAAAPDTQVATATPPPAAGPQTPATRSLPHPNTPVTAQQQTASTAPASNAAVPAVAAPAPAGATPQTYGAQGHARVVLRARGDTVVTVKSPDGQMILNRSLKSGDVYQVPATPGLSFATSDGGAVEIDLDGNALGRAGQPKQVLGRVSLDPRSLVDRFNSR